MSRHTRYDRIEPKFLYPWTAIVFYIWSYPSVYDSDIDVLSYLLLDTAQNFEWEDGRLVADTQFMMPVVRDREITLEGAKQRALYGRQDSFTILHYWKENCALIKLPPRDEVRPYWYEAVTDLILYVQKLTEEYYGLQVLAYCARHYGLDNPSGAMRYQQMMDEFREGVQRVDEFVLSREDMRHMSRANIQARKLPPTVRELAKEAIVNYKTHAAQSRR